GWPALALWRTRRGRGEPREWLLLALLTALALAGNRFVATYALAAAPFIARDLEPRGLHAAAARSLLPRHDRARRLERARRRAPSRMGAAVAARLVPSQRAGRYRHRPGLVARVRGRRRGALPAPGRHAA